MAIVEQRCVCYDSSTKNGLRQVKESSYTLSAFLGDIEKLSVAACTGETGSEPCISGLSYDDAFCQIPFSVST